MLPAGQVRRPEKELALRARYRKERFMMILVGLGTGLAFLVLFLVIAYALAQGAGALNLDFFLKDMHPPGETGGGLRQAIVGTLIVDGLGLLIALPFGLAAGILLAEYPDHPVNPFLRLLSDTLNGMPAILFGLLAFVLLVKPMGGFSGLSGSFALGFLMIPILARSTEGVLSLVPKEIREAGLALGLPRWRVILSLVLPTARAGLITGVLLAFARAAGEAAPLLFTAFGSPLLELNLLKPMDTLPLRLFAFAISPYDDWHRQAWAAGLVLFGLITLTSLLARWASRRI
ncbi:phosphate ABC transporter permease PstA [Thermus thalpophilus]|uniref:phosphate ABC transporter permease PstA n=1 Tax=Thermus thalpophilus TaxID=2908147 RepID=UPI001FAB2C72|nr:phosphate ABC transporter permease PstA [Thermus thalpophilus]